MTADTNSRILLLGATGQTGKLILERLIANNQRPVLIGRNLIKLLPLVNQYEKLEYALADAQDADSLRKVIKPGDILISTVGPFDQLGKIPLSVAVEQQAHYIDTSGEPNFTDHVYENYEHQLAKSQQLILTSCGFDYVPGQLAVGKLMESVSDKTTALKVTYATADGKFASLTKGTLNTLARAITEPGTFYNESKLYKDDIAAETHAINTDGGVVKGIRIPTLECREHPKMYPKLQDVDIYLAWFGSLGGMMGGFNKVQHQLYKIPGYRKLTRGLLRSLPTPSRSSPDITARENRPTFISAEAYDQSGELIGEYKITGPNIYYYTGAIAAWAAGQIQSGKVDTFGVASPLRAFGLSALEAAHKSFGFAEKK